MTSWMMSWPADGEKSNPNYRSASLCRSGNDYESLLKTSGRANQSSWIQWDPVVIIIMLFMGWNRQTCLNRPELTKYKHYSKWHQFHHFHNMSFWVQKGNGEEKAGKVANWHKESHETGSDGEKYSVFYWCSQGCYSLLKYYSNNIKY